MVSEVDIENNSYEKMSTVEHDVEYLYQLDPNKMQQDADYLAGVIGIDNHLVQNIDDDTFLLLCATILWRHLDYYSKTLYHQDLNNLFNTNPHLATELYSSMDDASLFSVKRAAWSISTKMLEEILKRDKKTQKVIEYISMGIGGSEFNVRELYQFVKSSLKLRNWYKPQTIIVGLVTFLYLKNLEKEEESVEKELSRRTKHNVARKII